MTVFERLQKNFHTNWSTVLVGWRGLGPFSPLPDLGASSPPLLDRAEVVKYATEKLCTSGGGIVEALSSDREVAQATREEIEAKLEALASQEPVDKFIELRKWRAASLEERLQTLSSDPLYALIELTEFWQEFGFPKDSPHEVQGRENGISPEDYYSEQTLSRLLSAHRLWLEREKASLRACN